MIIMTRKIVITVANSERIRIVIKGVGRSIDKKIMISIVYLRIGRIGMSIAVYMGRNII
jgi:hypothetical protein